MKMALVVGINYYHHGNPLYGCVNDAYSVKNMLERNDGGTVNFECRLMTASSNADSIERSVLKDAIRQLFTTRVETALFYFAGHGHIEATGGYLLASDARRGDEGVSLSEILTLANGSPALLLKSLHAVAFFVYSCRFNDKQLQLFPHKRSRLKLPQKS